MKRLVRILEAAIILVCSLPFAVLPYKCALKSGEVLGLLLFYVWRDRRKIAAGNIERALVAGALNVSSAAAAVSTAEAALAIARESFINLGKSFAEIVKIYYGLGDSIVRNVAVRGEEHFTKAKAKGRGVIMITGHCGNWELLSLAFGMKVSPASGVARALNNPYINMMIYSMRARYGNSIIYKKGALKGILACLKKGGVVGILIDQAVVQDEGFIINFMGRGAWTTKMPALIARKTGAPVIPAFVNREGAGHVMTIHPEVSLRREEMSESALKEDTQLLSNYVGEHIRKHPSEWLWIHRRWKRVEEQMSDNPIEGAVNRA
ncbi:MAG: lysophospholipid acyltransferase family protein [Nitrospirae bacterium]|nr:lysophospholipid acyltransferase family protein [Nitrospirota bacterium]